MLIRPFNPADAGSLAALFHASVRQAGLRDYSPEQVEAWSPTTPDPKSYLRRAEDRRVFVATGDDGEPIGYCDLESDGHIDHLYCHPDLVGTGVGSALYASIEAAAREAGITVLFVEASEAARWLFERRGFRVEARNDFVFNGVAIHNYRMSKAIG
jgi:putative acetyltransferase